MNNTIIRLLGLFMTAWMLYIIAVIVLQANIPVPTLGQGVDATLDVVRMVLAWMT